MAESFTEGYRSVTYGDAFADVYDRWYADVTDVAATVATVTQLAAGGLVVELGVGTGRLAVPLAAAGGRVIGLDVSDGMLRRFRAKAGAAVPAVRADMVAAPFRSGSSALVLVAYNTLFNLTTATAQRRAIEGSAAMLAPGGRLVVEAFVPPQDQSNQADVAPRTIDLDRVILTVARRDGSAQTITGQHIEITETGIRLRPWLVRYLTPAQLDDLAASAGLALESRWAGWREEPFDAAAVSHISVYRRP